MRQEDFEDAAESFIKDLMYYHYGELTPEALDGVMEEVHGVVDAVKITILQDIAMSKLIERTRKHEH